MASISGSVDLSSKLHSADFAEQIKKLDIEANHIFGNSRLLESSNTDSLFKTTGHGDPLSTYTDGSSYVKQNSSILATPQLSSILDFSSTRSNLEDLKAQMDLQAQETVRLERALLGEPSVLSGITRNVSSDLSSSLPALTTESHLASNIGVSYRPAGRQLSDVPESHLQRTLKLSQEEIAGLKQKLQEVHKQAEEQKLQFRRGLEEVRAKLQETITNRDSLLEIKDQETKEYEQAIVKLRMVVGDVEKENLMKDQQLQKMAETLQTLQLEQESLTSSVLQIGSLINSRDTMLKNRCQDNESILKQNPSLLLNSITLYIQEAQDGIKARSKKIEKLEDDLENIKKTSNENVTHVVSEYQEKLSTMTRSHEEQLLSLNEKSSRLQNEMANLESQLSVLHEQKALQIKIKEDYINDLETRLAQLKDEYETEQKLWAKKKKVPTATLR